MLERLREGYAYRFCIADDLAPKHEAEGGKWREWLEDEARKRTGLGVDIQVVGATALAEWASHFPSVVLQNELRTPPASCWHLEAWRGAATALTPKYVANPTWSATRERIAGHCDFATKVDRPVEAVQGAAGVGKTRLVYETLARTPNAAGLVVYTPDEKAAWQLALDFAGNARLCAILVADECSLEYRRRLEDALQDCCNRVRVVAIDNRSSRIRGLETQPLFLHRLPDDVIEGVLVANFEAVPEPDRRLAVALAGGFLRIAIDICQRGWAAGMGSAKPKLADYYASRVDEADRPVLEALSLVTRVGWTGEVDQEWADLCALCGIPAEDGLDRARRLKEVPGFVGMGGRYLYVTPEAIAEIALEQAYRKWIEPCPSDFFDRVPASIEEVFLSRIARCSNQRLREAAAAYSQSWVAALSGDDLPDKKKTERLIRLAEIEPDKFLPVVRRLVEGARPEVLRETNGSTAGGWGPRRSLVWLCERAAAFPEFFDDAESILFSLALHENEEGIGNNATEIWKQLYQLFLPGTSVPYLERLGLLRRRLNSGESDQALLALSAIGEVFQQHFGRTVGPPLFAGKIPPEDWRPSAVADERQCLEAALGLIAGALDKADPKVQEAALDLVLDKLWFLLTRGYLDWTRKLLANPVPVARLAKLLETIDVVLSLESRGSGSQGLPTEYLAAIRQWRDTLVPNDLHAQLVRDVGRNAYRGFDDASDAEWRSRLGALASQLITAPGKLKAEFPWLVSPEAKSGAALGEELAIRDGTASWLMPILDASKQGGDGLACGYVQALIEHHPQHQKEVKDGLDQIGLEDPLLVLKVSSVVPDQTSHYDRVLRGFDAGRIPVTALGTLRHYLGGEANSQARLEEVLTRILASSNSPRKDRFATALSLCGSWTRAAAEKEGKLRISPALKRCFRQLLTGFSPADPFHSHDWNQLLRVYGQLEPEDAIRIACRRIGRWEDYEQAAFLHHQAKVYPRVVMEAVGDALLDKDNGWKLRMQGVGGLLSSLPVAEVVRWLGGRGIAGARALASSLPQPYADDQGVPRVPALTEEVLQRFGDDEETQDAFIGGSGVRTYTGDIPAQYEAEARVASAFLRHPVAAIRKWAGKTKAWKEQDAKHQRAEDAERMVPV